MISKQDLNALLARIESKIDMICVALGLRPEGRSPGSDFWSAIDSGTGKTHPEGS